MKQQTAVDWLITEIDAQFPHINIRWKEEMIDKAKEMEKDQMIDFAEKHSFNMTSTSAEGFYTETYGK